ncbi:hypothetical protein BU17DRAFT_37150 [Hysterangium stoloniferum]|nr:hypothetical protein BU17DRAFT_37150 [Hysterangium stoloniferum]
MLATSSNPQSEAGATLHDGDTDPIPDEGDTESSAIDYTEDQGDEDGCGENATKVVQPLSAEALAEFNAAQERAGIIYISRIPPGMRPTKVRHLMNGYGEVGRVYLQQEGKQRDSHSWLVLMMTSVDAKRAYLRRKHTSTKKAHYTEGWVEFKDKKVARSVAEMLNAQPIGGKKGTRWRDDVWTMKYLPRFKWNMLTEQVAHEAALHTARLRVELSQSRAEQQDYLKQVELARVLDKRAERKRKAGEEVAAPPAKVRATEQGGRPRPNITKKGPEKVPTAAAADISHVIKNIF